MGRGGAASLQTLAIESEMREVQQRTGELQKKGNCLIKQVETLIQKQKQILKQRKISTEKQQYIKILPLQFQPLSKQNPINYYEELKKSCIQKESKEKDMRAPTDTSCMNEHKEDSLETDQKYLDLIDLLTVQMFQTDSQSGAQKDNNKSNSLPRSFEKPDPPLQKSSSQTFFAAKTLKLGSIPSGQLSAYERLFGIPSPDSRSSSPMGREKKKVFIPKHNSRVRHTSGSQERPTVLETSRKIEVKRLSSRSEENVSSVGRQTNENRACEVGKNNQQTGKRRSSKISADTIDSLFSAPAKIDIPERMLAEEVNSLRVNLVRLRYIFEQDCPVLSREEQQNRENKADMVRRMIAGNMGTLGTERERLLAVNQAMARQVVMRSKEMAGRNTVWTT